MNLTGRPIYQKGAKPAKSKQIRQASKGQTCLLNIPGICTGDPETTVDCHLRLFGVAGMAQKPDDVLILDACSACHAILDSRDKWAAAGIGFDDVLRALMLTLLRRREAGLIILKGGDV